MVRTFTPRCPMQWSVLLVVLDRRICFIAKADSIVRDHERFTPLHWTAWNKGVVPLEREKTKHNNTKQKNKTTGVRVCFFW